MSRISDEDKLWLKEKGFDQSVYEVASSMVFERGEFIFQEGRKVDNMFIVKSGTGKVSKLGPQGKELLISFYKEKDYMGYVELFQEGVGLTNVEVIDRTECIAVPFWFCKKEVDSNIDFLKYINTILSQVVSRMDNYSTANMLLPLETRLCALIDTKRNGDKFKGNLTNIAMLMGVSYRHMLRTMKGLCEEGVLKKEKSHYLIINNDLLKEKSEDSYMPFY